MTEKFNPNALRNPSSGLLGRNPTHQEIAAYADDQSDIVRAINESGVKRMRVTYDYADLDPANPPPLSGILNVRDMTEDQARQFCRTLMRSRPNIFKVDIRLGDHPSARKVDSIKARMLNSNKPRFHTELGDKLGDILADRSMCVTRIVYTVHNAEPGYFHATGEVYSTTPEEYENDQLFKPTINFEFIKTT